MTIYARPVLEPCPLPDTSFCGLLHERSGITCDRPLNHAGDHEGSTTFDWPREETCPDCGQPGCPMR